MSTASMKTSSWLCARYAGTPQAPAPITAIFNGPAQCMGQSSDSADINLLSCFGAVLFLSMEVGCLSSLSHRRPGTHAASIWNTGVLLGSSLCAGVLVPSGAWLRYTQD